MNNNGEILIWIILGGAYILSYLIYKSLTNNYKKRYKSLYMVGLLLIIFQILCYYIEYLADFQLFASISIMGMYPLLYTLMSRKEEK